MLIRVALVCALALSHLFVYAADLTSLNAPLEEIRAAHKLPALAAAVIVSGEILGTGAVGVRKYGDPTPVTVRDQFHLGSCTKAMTGTLAMIFVEKGKIAWTATLESVFPELAAKMDPAMRGVTLEQLLAHRSGLAADNSGASEAFKFELAASRSGGSLAERRLKFVEAISSAKPAKPPGESFTYANCNFVLAAAMLERVTGKPWEELATENIFKPLGMASVGFGAMGEAGKVLQPWQHVLDKNGKLTPINPGPNSDNPELMTPAGRVHCSMEDWAKFVLEHVRGENGKSQLLKAKSFELLHQPSFKGDYVAGWNVTRRNWATGAVLNHNGTNTMNFAVVWMAPADGFAVLVATNQGGDDAAKACDEVAAKMIGLYGKKK